MSPGKSRVPAAANTLAILQVLTAADVPMSAARITQETGLPRSTVYHLLSVMEQAGFVVHLAEEQAYGLGVAAYEMASSYSRQQPLVRVGRRYAAALAMQVGGSTHISRLSGSEVVYLLEERAPDAVRLLTDVGVRLDAYRTASGKAMMAYLPAAEVKAAVGVHGVGGRDFSEFEHEICIVRQRGWAEETGLVSPGQESLAVPLFDHLGRASSSLALTYRQGSLAESKKQQLLAEMVETAGKIASTVYGSNVLHLHSLGSQTI